MVKNRALINKAHGSLCDICDQKISDQEAENGEFEYSKIKRKSDIWVHRHCWDELYGKQVVE